MKIWNLYEDLKPFRRFETLRKIWNLYEDLKTCMKIWNLCEVLILWRYEIIPDLQAVPDNLVPAMVCSLLAIFSKKFKNSDLS